MIELNEQRKKVFEDRYAARDKQGNRIDNSPEEMWQRVAYAISDGRAESENFQELLRDFKFVPGGRILAGAGAGTEQTFYNCFVIPVEPKESTRNANPEVGADSREAIFDTIGTMVDIMSRGGGVGINWSVLRPSGSYLGRVSGTSSGPVGWMDVASKAVGEVEQGGSRRGAAMFMLDDWHPDILKFVEAKRDFTRITNANVSVAVSDAFMAAVENGRDWDLIFPDTTDPRYNTDWDGDITGWIASGGRVVHHSSVPAQRIWDAIVESAWASGEPGLVFLDRYNKQSTGRHAERIICVNPCGEQGLGAYSVCNLGSMNLTQYVNDKGYNYGTMMDWKAFTADVKTAVRFLDNAIDKNHYFDKRTEAQQKKLRRIGLGVMGLADTLIMLGMRYGSPEAVELTERIFRAMKDAAIEESVALAVEKGPAEAYVPEVWDRPYLKEYVSRNHPLGFPSTNPGPLRNLFFLTQAPTGTTSILAGVNSGIEPFFALGYWREDRTGKHWVEPQVIADLRKGRALDMWDDKPDYVVTADDVSVEEHIAMQAAVQKYVDSSVSKTINGPNSHTVEDVDKAYRQAYASGLKGLAYFRDGSGRAQVLTKNAPEDETKKELEYQLIVVKNLKNRIAQLEEETFVRPETASEWRRPMSLTGRTSRLNTSVGTLYLTINRDDSGNAREVFVNVGKAGSDVMAMGEAIGRLISLGLQMGTPIPKLAAQLVGVGGTSSFNPGLVHAIGKALSEEAGAEATALPPELVGKEPIVADPLLAAPTNKTSGSLCPDCGNFSVVREEGCSKCQLCGFSAC